MKIFLLFLSLMSYALCHCQQLSENFGANGVATLPLEDRTTRGHKIEQLTDGYLLVAVNSDYLQWGALFDRNFYVYKLTPNGTIDPSFGTNGYFFVPSGSFEDESYLFSITYSPSQDAIYILAKVQGAGKLMKLSADGMIDTSYGIGGYVDAEDFYDHAIQQDGEVVLLGWSFNSSYLKHKLKRISTDGTPDTSFGVNGEVIQDLTTFDRDFIMAGKIQPDNKIVVVGYSYTVSEPQSYATIARYNTDGTLDNTFGVNGFRITNIGTDNYGIFSALDIGADGTIIAAGYNMHSGGTGGGHGNKSVLAKYDPNGNLITTFADNGVKIFASVFGANDHFNAVRFLTDGKIVAGGSSGSFFPVMQSYFYLTKVNADGDLDAGFFTNGSMVSYFDNAETNALFDIAVSADNEIFSTGISGNDGTFTAVVCKMDDPLFSTSEHSLLGTSVYPNPAKDILTVRSLYSISEIRIFSMGGSTVLRNAYINGTKEINIDMEMLESGIYVVELVDFKGQKKRQKVLKI